MSGRWFLLASIALGLTTMTAGIARAQADGEAVLNARCATCHERTAEGGLARINEQRKTPEGWDMTIVRMMVMHGVEIGADERATLVKHLADSQGMAPAETADWRYILERHPAVFETPESDEVAAMCARCHSYARVALQRRTEAEWRTLSHFHLGQYPTTEYQALGRDRNWWEIASGPIPTELAQLYPLETDAWTAWQGQPNPDLSGSWRFVGDEPGGGLFHGSVEVTATGTDTYELAVTETHADGRTVTSTGNAILYTGYEWRSRTTTEDGVASLQVLALGEDGMTSAGRTFAEEMDSVGGQLTAAHVDGPPQVIAVLPPYLKAGESAELTLVGVGMGEAIDLGAGVTIDEVVAADATTVVVRASAAADAAVGARDVTAGDAAGAGALAVYDQVATVSVEPAYNIARVGGGGGPIPPVPAAFSAIGWAAGPDGEVRLGQMPAAFSVEDFDETAAAMADAEFAGAMQPNGLFLPAEAGPNPERPFQTNNAGNLKVVATVRDGDRVIAGEGQLLVTVQRWNDPPIR